MKEEGKRKFWKLGVVGFWGEIVYFIVWWFLPSKNPLPSEFNVVYRFLLWPASILWSASIAVQRQWDFLLAPIYLIAVFALYLWLVPYLKKSDESERVKLAYIVGSIVTGVGCYTVMLVGKWTGSTIWFGGIPWMGLIIGAVLGFAGVALSGFSAAFIMGLGASMIMGAGIGFTEGFGISFIVALAGLTGTAVGIITYYILDLVILLHKKAFGVVKAPGKSEESSG